MNFAVRVRPRASKSAVAGEHGGALKIRLAAPPAEGQANDELTRFLAKLFDVPRAQIAILSGQTSRNKIVRVGGVSVEYCGKVLAEAMK